MRDRREWLETDGLGGFATGTVDGVRTRRYHGLLVAAATPPTGRFMLVNGLEAWLETAGGERFDLSWQQYAPDVIHPAAATPVESFSIEPWPTWLRRLPGGGAVRQELLVSHGRPLTAITWRLEGADVLPGKPWRLFVRLLHSGRDYHALHRENPAFRFEPDARPGGRGLVWRPYPGVPAVAVTTNGRYRHDPVWYRSFLYEQERDRGFECIEDLASPGFFEFDLGAGGSAAAELLLEAGTNEPAELDAADLREIESRRRRAFKTPLARSADCYIVKRGEGRTIIAGYPWFADWGRDTFIALRGLCLGTSRLDDAREILLAWAGTISEGMVPNRFPDSGGGGEPEFNSVDASLWYIIAVHEYLEVAGRGRTASGASSEGVLRGAVLEILRRSRQGTRYGIKADTDGLLSAGEPGQQLTWMDARAGGREVTPRIGKPVEVQALWLNALRCAERWTTEFHPVIEAGLASFSDRFWNAKRRCLYDVIDVDHSPGAVDGRVRPNQILAIGGLPMAVLSAERAAATVDTVERLLWTPRGLRTLSPDDPAYTPRYEGGPDQRDAAYHQGTVWPWLVGAFVEAWIAVRGGGSSVRAEAHDRFVRPLLEHLEEAGIGHVSEIFNGDAPHAPHGCPFQAWSMSELIRMTAVASPRPPQAARSAAPAAQRVRR